MAGGYIEWEGHEYLDDSFYLGGRLFDVGLEEAAGGITVADDDGVVVLETLAGTGIVQAPYRGTKAPRRADRKTFTVAILADTEDDFLHVERMKSLGHPVFFVPFVWAMDTFDAVGGSTYTLTRPTAAGVVAEITAGTHPPIIYLDGEIDPGAASLAGQTVTASATGELSVYYLPAFRVAILGLSRTVTEYNRLFLRWTLSEVVEGDFQ